MRHFHIRVRRVQYSHNVISFPDGNNIAKLKTLKGGSTEREKKSAFHIATRKRNNK